jgi:hypothetical protein
MMGNILQSWRFSYAEGERPRGNRQATVQVRGNAPWQVGNRIDLAPVEQLSGRHLSPVAGLFMSAMAKVGQRPGDHHICQIADSPLPAN